GLMEFIDMARVHDVDPQLINRTRRWLLSQRRPNGSWNADRGAHLAGGESGSRLAVTAYVAWAVFSDEQARADSRPTIEWLLNHRPDDIKDAHTLALVCNALLAIDPERDEIAAYLDRLVSLRKRSEDGALSHWQRPANERTLFYGGGLSGQVETTALA